MNTVRIFFGLGTQDGRFYHVDDDGDDCIVTSDMRQMTLFQRKVEVMNVIDENITRLGTACIMQVEVRLKHVGF